MNHIQSRTEETLNKEAPFEAVKHTSPLSLSRPCCFASIFKNRRFPPFDSSYDKPECVCVSVFVPRDGVHKLFTLECVRLYSIERRNNLQLHRGSTCQAQISIKKKEEEEEVREKRGEKIPGEWKRWRGNNKDKWEVNTRRHLEISEGRWMEIHVDEQTSTLETTRLLEVSLIVAGFRDLQLA